MKDGPTQPVEPVEPVKPVEPVRPKKPAGAVSMFGGVDLFGGSKSPPFSVAAAKSRVPVKPKGSTVFLFLPLPNRETTNTSYIGLWELFLPQPWKLQEWPASDFRSSPPPPHPSQSKEKRETVLGMVSPTMSTMLIFFADPLGGDDEEDLFSSKSKVKKEAEPEVKLSLSS